MDVLEERKQTCDVRTKGRWYLRSTSLHLYHLDLLYLQIHRTYPTELVETDLELGWMRTFFSSTFHVGSIDTWL